jgi:hypothetical protein
MNDGAFDEEEDGDGHHFSNMELAKKSIKQLLGLNKDLEKEQKF